MIRIYILICCSFFVNESSFQLFTFRSWIRKTETAGPSTELRPNGSEDVC